MTIVYINTGSTANAGDGDSLRSAFNKVNQNFRYIDGDIAGFGFTGSKGDAGGYTGSAGNPSAPGINGYVGSQGYTGSAGAGYTGSAGAGYTGSAGAGYTGSAGVGYTGSASTATGYTGSAGTGGTALSDRLTTGSYSVVLGSDGTLTLPNATTISSVDFGSRFFSSSNGPGGVAVQQNSLTVGIANTAFAAAILANPGSYRISFNGGLNDVVIAGISGPASGTNVYTLTGTWPANTTGFPINIAGPDYIAGGVTELASDYGARIATNGGSWAFGANGVLTAPGHIVPNADLAYDLGSTSSQWRSIYVGTGTIYIGGVALGVNENNYVTVDGNPIITINTAGNLTVQGDVNIGTVTVSDTAPTATTGTQWFDTVEGRTYVATGGVWLDASPTQIPSPETYLDGLAIDGTVISTANVDGDAIVIDGGDNTKLTVSNNSVTIQVPGSGIIRPYWAAEFGGITTAVTTSSYTIGTGAFYDSVGNVYVLGGVLFGDDINDVDSLLLKYDTNGNLLWSRTWHDNSGNNCGAVNQAFAIDSNDRIYWLATDAISGGCWTGYMDTDGNLGLGGIAQGSLGFNNAGVSVVDIACDNSGNYYLAGSHYGEGTTPVVIKVDGNSGAPIWTGRIIPEDYEDLPADGQYRAVTVNPATGDVWAIGDYIDNGNLLAMLSKWDVNGVHQWTKKLVTSSGDLASAVIYNGGYVYTIVNDDGSQEAIVSKFDTDGDLIWASYLATGVLDPIPDGGPSPSNTGAYDLSFDASGNVYVTGTIPGPPEGQSQLWITKLNPANGEMLYSRILITDAGLVVIDQGAVGSSSSGHRVGDIYQDKIAITAVTTSDIDDSTSTNETRVMVAQLPIDGSVTGTFGNITIGDVTSDIDSICSTGTYTVTTLVWSIGTSTAIYSTSSISVSYVTDIVGLTGETLALGSVSGSSTATNTWTFVNNNIILPPGGDIFDSFGVSVLGISLSTPTLVSDATDEMSEDTEANISFTAEAYSVVVVASGSETYNNNGDPAVITGITGMGLTWLQRSAYTDPTSNVGQRSEIWYAVNNTNSALSDTITITFDATVDDQATSVSNWTGCNLTNPWTSSGPRYSNSVTGNGNATVTMTVAESSSTGFVFFAIPNYGMDDDETDPGYAVGWTDLNNATNGGAEYYEYINVSYKHFTSPQSNLVVISSGGPRDPQVSGSDGLTVIADALIGSRTATGTTALGDRLVAGTWTLTLSTTGTVTLPQGGVISEVTVDDGIRDPSVGILLTPYADPGTNPDMAVKIYPTFNDDDHIHIVAGDPTTVDLFLGDDDQYVKLEQNHGNIVIGTNTTVTNNTWTFGTDGRLTLPQGSTIGETTSTETLTLAGAGLAVVNQTYIKTSPTLYTGSDGVTVELIGGVIWYCIQNGDAKYTSATGTGLDTWVNSTGGLPVPTGTINGLPKTVNITVGTETWAFGGDGSLTFPDATVQTTAWTGTSVLVNGTYTVALSTTGQLNLPGAANAESDHARIQSANSIDILSNLSIWTFGIDGKLTLPNSTNIAIPSGTPRTGAIAITSSTELLIGTNTTTTNNLWTFGIDGSTVFPENTVKGYCFTATNAVFNYIAQAGSFYYTDSPILGLISTIGGAWYIKGPGLVGWKQITAVQDNGGVALIVRIGGGASPMGDGSEFHSGGYQPNSPDLVYTISQYLDLDLKAADKTWTFSENGSLTFPDATVQTTAFTTSSYISKETLKSIVADSTDFANFQTRIAAL